VKRLALVIVLLAALAGCGEHEPSGFLDRYVQDDGRVVRQDQGGDTVSEGQAYALLLAVAAGDQERFARVWDWTRTHLRRSDGLLAWRWADEHVVDDEPATDADLDTARALLLAGRRFHEPRYREAAMDLKRAIVDGETTWAADRTVLVAGPWARDGRIMVNPSYWSPKAFQQLGFEKVEQSSRQLTQRLLESALPPDWARVEPFGIFPAGPPSGGEPGYSYDALRVPIRLAESCNAADRRLATTRARRSAAWTARPPATPTMRPPSRARPAPPGRPATTRRRATCSTARTSSTPSTRPTTAAPGSSSRGRCSWMVH
jgi:endo-1,4-beta-D-glucanase Y